MPCDNLWKLLEAFETADNPVLALKRTSVKRGVEGAIALAQSHGEEVDWEKVGSSLARPLSEMGGFFQKAKLHAPKIVSLKEVILAHMVREVDIQPNHPGSSPHGRRFGFLLLKKHCKGFPYRILFKKRLYRGFPRR
jgi:hypothetical protein